jgi:hypothetical protein
MNLASSPLPISSKLETGFLDLVDSTDPFHWLSVRGHVAEVTEEGADAHIDKLAKKYIGVDIYPNHRADETRIILKITPERVIAR